MSESEVVPVLSPVDIDRLPKKIPFEKIVRLKHSGLTHKEIAKLCDCTEGNIDKRLAVIDDDPERTKYFKNTKSEYFEKLQSDLFALTPKDIKSMSPGQRIWAGSTIFDKQRLQDDKSTSNINNLHSYHQNEANLDDIEKKLAAMGVNVIEETP